jgi:hypothetical protein
MSELPPKAEVDPRSCDVAQVPKAAVSGRSKAASLFDDLVGAGEQRRRNLDAERFGSLS